MNREELIRHLWGNVDPSHALFERQQAWRRNESQIPPLFAEAEPSGEAGEWLADVIRTAEPAHEPDDAEGRYRPYPKIAKGASLLLLGPTGAGKTHQAVGAFASLLAVGLVHTGRIVTAADLCAKMRPRPGVDSEDVFIDFAGASLLVLDDIGASKVTEWTEEVLYRLVNHRYTQVLPTIFTSNVPPAELAGMLGDRVSSRLVGMCTRVVLRGPDRRRP